MNLIISFFFLLTFLQIRSINVSGQIYKTSKVAPEDIAGKWKLGESAIKKLATKAMKSMVPSLFNLALKVNISSACRSSLMEMSQALFNQKVWALKMLDASGKNTDGIFSGSITSLGDYDQCLGIKSDSNNFQGKYCSIDFDFPLPPRRPFSRIEDEIPELKDIMEPGTLGAEAVKYAQYMYVNQGRMAACVPSTCSADDVQSITRTVFESLDFYFDVHVLHCDILEYVPFTTGESLIIILFVTLLTIVTTSTVIDLVATVSSSSEEFSSTEKSLPRKFMLSFSAYTNFLKLLKKDDNPDTLTIFHGLRVITIVWIILCHTYFTVNFRAHNGLLHAKDIPKGFWFTPVMTGHLSVETFIFMSSVLVSYLGMRVRGKVNIPLFFLKRYWRLTPTMMLVVALAVIAGRFSSGPLWQETFVENMSDRCKRSGWWNLLYINNFFPLTDVCLSWTWYLSTDTQLFFIGLYLVKLLKNNVKKGIIVLFLLSLFGVVWTAATVIYYRLPPTYLQSYFNYEDWTLYAAKIYTPVQIHLPTSSIGLFVGYILATKKIHIPKRINLIGWIFSGITMIVEVFAVYPWNQGKVPDVAMSALYASTHRVFWGLCLAFITISCTTKKKGIVYDILSWNAFIPLGRLTYLAYLIHYILIYFYTASIRATYAYNHQNILFLFFSILTLTFFIACLLSLVIESPFMALEKVLTKGEMEKKIIPLNFTNVGVEEKNLKECV